MYFCGTLHTLIFQCTLAQSTETEGKSVNMEKVELGRAVESYEDVI